jgi:hypothetical protein
MPAIAANRPDLHALAAAMRPVLQRYRVRSAAVFGSVARGDAGPDSDLDLLLEYSRGTTLFDLVDLRRDLEQATGRPVQLVSAETLKPRLRERVEREKVGVLLKV